MSNAAEQIPGTNEIEPESADIEPAFNPAAFSGSRDLMFAQWLAEQAINAHALPATLSQDQRDIRAAGILAQLKAIAPRSGLEGMLAAQMVTMHGTGCELLRRAVQPGESVQQADILMRTTTRMMTLFARQTELLLRLRGSEKQTLRIEHVRKAEDGRVSVTAEAERAGAA